ncbi:DUF2917 domain-containing protein [uncultured Ramlibacter sp.]|uniref:DUF2917 domain-containing protein n=1 Tax=uncultured Ramlibacter sp. TaxID=260755 RepID=UPI0026292336|nr:DUF2917 domain-containing protein [uncultured Ramlibacter sp.]
MSSQTLSQLQQSSAPALPGTWKLDAGRAISLRPREDGVLRIAHGRLWATFDGPHGGPPNDQGDEILGVGDQLRLRTGQRLVVEAWDAQAPAYFSWEPVPQAVASPSRRFAPVLQPLADLRLAAVLGAGAAARLVAGLAALALGGVSGRAARADCAFNAQSRACRAHGAIS